MDFTLNSICSEYSFTDLTRCKTATFYNGTDEWPDDSSVLPDPECSSRRSTACGFSYNFRKNQTDKGTLALEHILISWTVRINVHLKLFKGIIALSCAISNIARNLPRSPLKEGFCQQIRACMYRVFRKVLVETICL